MHKTILQDRNALKFLRFFSALIILFTLAAHCFGQDRDVFAPFVSRLSVKPEGPGIILTWKKSPDVKGGYVLFRHSQEITESNLEKSVRVAEVGPDTESYIDYPADTTPYYYAVIGKNNEGNLHKLFIPFRNKTIRAISIETLPKEEQTAAKIADIEAISNEDVITVSFKASPSDRSLIVYRGTKPFESASDLSGATLVTTVSSANTSVKDYPVPGIEYYYGIIDSGLLKVGSISFTAGKNATDTPVSIASTERIGLKPIVSGDSRSVPLPLLPVDITVQSGKILSSPATPKDAETQSLTDKTKEALTVLYTLIPKREQRNVEPEILPEDNVVHERGDAYTLQIILNGPFKQKDWGNSVVKFKNFLRIHRNEKIEARARFYLGQSLFFLNRIREGFLEFLLSSEHYYAPSREWMNILFQRLQQG